ncbi:GEVED domain-containing protein [Chryseobacterium binzhouense]|uniref:GEVED domain-containing protein n=1 Tax=Chryseobacterium binzhouense TaxID=2593646 RepID=UPI00117CDD6A|nr:GEVED domain-containing protein [Chryseobacterium binzhouense]
MKNKILTFLICLANVFTYSQSCTVNAGGSKIICGTTTTLSGSSSGTASGSPSWSLVSKPSGATDPIITSGNTLTPSISGLNTPGNYVFRISQTCTTGGTVTSDVTITASGSVATFTAGPDITNIAAATGVATLNATIPAGYTASWTYYNLYSFQRFGTKVTTNATLTGTTTASPTLTLTNKSDHTIDPSYVAVLRITSITNPSCFYEDEAIVRFIPNPQITLNTTVNYCVPSTGAFSLFLNNVSPKFTVYSITPGASGTTTTTITLNVISQPSGGNIAFDYLDSNAISLSGLNVTGTYTFTLTVANSTGTYTTPTITYNYNGAQPRPVSFIDSAFPDQIGLYASGGSAGAVYCNRAGSTTPIVVGFKIDPADPATNITNFQNSAITPPGGAPTIVQTGSGTYNRTATITPPSGGWRVGTYRFAVSNSNGSCNGSSQVYYIHISDGNRPAVNVNNFTVCYPGSGSVSATVPLPAVYKGVVNSSYFQDFSGYYELTTISKPSGSANPLFEATNLRSLESLSTVISNLNAQGEYVFKIKAIPSNVSIADFLGKEYACAGTSLEDTFSVFVSTQVNANAGSDFTTGGAASTTLNGNNPTPSNGVWTVVSSPSGATPTFVNASSNNTQVNGLTVNGNYVFRWTISTGTCTSSDDVQVTVVTPLLEAVNDIFNPVIAGSTTTSVIANDKNIAGGQAVIGTSEGQVSIAALGTWPAGFTLNPNGTISVASTVTAGTYDMNYRICNQIAGTPCDDALVTITVVTPFDCTGKIYSLSSVTGEIRMFNNPTTSGALGSVINTTPHPTAISAAPNGPNALGFSISTNKFYYVLNQNGGTGNTFVSYDPTTNTYETLASTNGYIYRGTVTNDGLGYYGITSTNVLKYYDIANNTWTNITNNYVDQNGQSLNTLLNTYSGGDIAMDGNGDLWILAGTASSGTAYVFRVKSAVPKTNMAGAPLVLEQIVKQNIGTSPNGISFNPAGELFITNATTLFKMNNDFSISSVGAISNPANGGGDLASCAAPLNPFAVSDFGDAPDSYKTLLASDGPRHSVSQYDATNNTSSLMIGSKIDLENDGFAGVMSNGDDINNIFDEGSVTFPILNTTSTTYTATVPVINTTGVTVNLKGWIDFNKNGTFDASEGASATVADGVTSVTLIWSGLSGLTEGITYYRLRIAKSATEIANPTGVAFGGEVEDGKFTISGPAFCYEDPTLVSGATYPVKHGITVLGRAGADNGGWPMNRNSAYTALESKTKGLVITRNSNPEGTIAIPVVGMMVFDTDENAGAGCLKIYTGSGAGEGWKCFSTQSCP